MYSLCLLFAANDEDSINASNNIAWEPRLFQKPGRKYSHGNNVLSIGNHLELRPAGFPGGGYPGDLLLELRHSIQQHRLLAAATSGGFSVKLLLLRSAGEEGRPQTEDLRAWHPDVASNDKTHPTC